MSRSDAGMLVLLLTLHTAPPVSFAEAALALPSDAPTAEEEEFPDEISRRYYSKFQHFPPPDPATAKVDWPEELLGPRFLRASYGTRVRATLMLMTFFAYDSAWRDGPFAEHAETREAEADRMRLILEGIVAQAEACPEPTGSKHLLCAFVDGDPDTTGWALEYRDHAVTGRAI